MDVLLDLQTISAMTSSDGYWSINKTLTKKIGFETTFYLQYILSSFHYFFEKKSNDMKIIDGEYYFFRTANDIENDTGLSRYQQDKNRVKLEELGIIKTKLSGVPAKTYFTIDTDKYINIFETSLQKTSKLDCKKLGNKSLKNLKTYNKNKINKNKEKENINKDKYLEFVFLSKSEYDTLLDIFGERKLQNAIETLNNYIGSKGKDKYKSHYHTIRTWNKEIVEKYKLKQEATKKSETWRDDLII